MQNTTYIKHGRGNKNLVCFYNVFEFNYQPNIDCYTHRMLHMNPMAITHKPKTHN